MKWRIFPEINWRRVGLRRGQWVLPIMVMALLFTAASASAATLRVCHSGCRYAGLAAAVAAARDGDTIELGPGTYRGGVTIDASVNLDGAGTGTTVIEGGGPVLTIGAYGASSEPTVVIDAVTITGGVTRSSPISTPFTGEEGVFATGGGVEIPPNADFTGGAAVTIKNSIITRNRVAPTHTIPVGPNTCPEGNCPFALAGGGGIDSWGTLALINTTITDNRVGSASGLSTVTSDAEGGAILSQLGALTLQNTTITGNQASATAPNGRFADSGAIFVENGSILMSNSRVTDNLAVLQASLPNSVDMLAVAGGIHASSTASGVIRNSIIADNSVNMTNTLGNANVASGGLQTDADVTITNDVIAENRVSSATLTGSSGDAEGDSGAGEMSGTITNTRITGNAVTVSSAAGAATASAGATIFAGSIANSIINDNHVLASSPAGSVWAAGGGIQSGGTLTVRNTKVTANHVAARGLTGTARGGGIFDAEAPNGPPGGPLTLEEALVSENELSASPGITRRGGGIFATNPVTSTNTRIAANTPDQCDGC